MTSHLDPTARKRLDEWLERAAANAPSGAPEDIHIDEIDGGLLDKSRWVVGGLELLNAALGSPRLPDADWMICLVFHLNPDAGEVPLSAKRPEDWTDSLGVTPPELVLVRAHDHAKFLQEFGREIGILSVGGAQSSVYVTDRRDHYGDEVERVRHIWVVAGR